MRRELCLMAALCLLVSLLAVVMATGENMGPGPQAVAMATETKSGQGPRPSFENNQRPSSLKLGSEYKLRTIGSNSSITAAGKGHIHVLLSSSDQEKHVMKPSVPVSQEGKGQIPTETSSEKKSSSIAASPYDPDQDYGTGRLLVAVARTLVTSTASTTTVTVLSTCNVFPGTPAAMCPRRKKRKLVTSSQAYSETGLDSSIESGPVLSDKPIERAGRLILWSSSITTILFAATSTNGATIVTVSYSCSPAGISACG